MSRPNTTTLAPTLGPRLPAEDIPVGQEIDCGSHEVTADEIIEFATHWDPQYFHVDIQNLRFLRPLRAGGVLTGSVLIRSVEPDGRGPTPDLDPRKSPVRK